MILAILTRLGRKAARALKAMLASRLKMHQRQADAFPEFPIPH